jgi:hypothetical protein
VTCRCKDDMALMMCRVEKAATYGIGTQQYVDTHAFCNSCVIHINLATQDPMLVSFDPQMRPKLLQSNWA